MDRSPLAGQLLRDLGPRGGLAPRAVQALEAALIQGAGGGEYRRWQEQLWLPATAESRRTFAAHAYLAAALRAVAARLTGGRKLYAPEADLFSWPAREGLPGPRLGRLLRGVEPDRGPELAGLPGALYQQLVAPGARRGLGEYYTPAWLVRTVYERLNEPAYLPGAPLDSGLAPRLLDPACGAGAFVAPAVSVLSQNALAGGLGREAALALALASVAGVDINPVALLAARVSCLAALAGLMPRRGRLPRLPLYRADSILGPLPRLAPFDLVAGNPPWVGWQSLSPEYRRATAPLWREAGLFVHGGMAAILGPAKKELATLMVARVARRQLASGGKMALLLGSAVWKTASAARGFRVLRLGPDGPPLGVLSVEDLGRRRVFSGASVRASLAVMRKGQATRYPVPYRLWLDGERRLELLAEPVDRDDAASPWLTAPRRLMPALRKVLSPAGAEPAYRARAGACTWANGVFWLEVLGQRADGTLQVRNHTRGARRRVEAVEADLEPDLVYPLLRGRDVTPGRACPRLSILLTQDPETRRGIAPEQLRRDLPLTRTYLARFEQTLRARSGFRRYYTRRGRGGAELETGPFYSLFNVGPYTLSPWKVVWREQSRRFTVAAVGPVEARPVVPDHKLMMIPCASEAEARYLAALLGSPPAALAVWAHTVHIQQSTHLLNALRIPAFDPEDPAHRAGDYQRVWGLDHGQLQEIDDFLDSLPDASVG